VALVGIGNELRGDDAAGVLVARRLYRQLSRQIAIPKNLLIIDAGTAPENCTGAVRRFAPGQVVLVDAMDWGGEPGGILWADGSDTRGWSGSTHTLPLSVLAAYLEAELGCVVTIAGIQPACLDFTAPLSSAVDRAVDELVEGFALEYQ
jgi:hydrogenase 3 maturation protease